MCQIDVIRSRSMCSNSAAHCGTSVLECGTSKCRKINDVPHDVSHVKVLKNNRKIGFAAHCYTSFPVSILKRGENLSKYERSLRMLVGRTRSAANPSREP